MQNERVKPSLLLSIIPLLTLIGLLFFSYSQFGSSVSDGSSQIVLLTATAVASVLAVFFCKVKWETIEKAMCQNILSVSGALLMLFLIGSLSGIWMVSGVVPTMIYYGVQMLNPDFFLCSCCIICAVVSVVIGSSYTTIATIGVALMGIGKIQGFPDSWIAGAIISGAYFGDKVSPLSDTTVLAASVTDTPIFSHIRFMQNTTIPTMTIALVLFAMLSYGHSAMELESVQELLQALDGTFIITPWLLLVPVLTFFLIVKKVPTLVILFVGILLACVCGLLLQPGLLSGVAEGGNIFKGLLVVLYGETSIETGNLILNDLVSTHGMSGMMNTVWLTMCAMCFGGAMQSTGMLECITHYFLKLIRGGVSMVASTIFSGILFNIIAAEQYISIILTGNMFKDVYKEKGYESKLLSRTVEDSVTVTSVLIPWNGCGMVQASILGVPTIAYLPYCFFNLLNPIISILVMAVGFQLRSACRFPFRMVKRVVQLVR